MGRGYFDHTHMPWAPPVYTDSMKDDRVAGWGWCSFTGHYDFGVYGSADRKKCIDALEGDAVLRAATALGHLWKTHRVPFYIDSSSFQLSFVKGRSKAERLNTILRQLYELSVSLDCIFVEARQDLVEAAGRRAFDDAGRLLLEGRVVCWNMYAPTPCGHSGTSMESEPTRPVMRTSSLMNLGLAVA